MFMHVSWFAAGLIGSNVGVMKVNVIMVFIDAKLVCLHLVHLDCPNAGKH